MNFKIDTKDKMHVITINESILSVNMTDEIQKKVSSYLNAEIANVILNLEPVNEVATEIVDVFRDLHGQFYEANHSFVICNVKKSILKNPETEELWEDLNITPTESEAWDIVQMEEIERELLD